MTQAINQLAALADYLQEQRSKILQAWHHSVADDPQLTTADKLSRIQFTDHIPQVLDAYERRLRAEDPGEKRRARIEQRESAAEHGLHRWQQGYDQRETMREWGHLHLCVLREHEVYAAEHQWLEESVMPTARATLVRLCAEGVCESAARFARLQQMEAASRVRDLEQALQNLSELERERTEMWRAVAHDMRGTVSVISNASAILTSDAVEDPARTQFSGVLERSVASLRGLLGDLLDLGRLEAGQEQRKIVAFDAATILKEFCESMRILASQRNLFLKTDGPPTLPVKGDPTKVRRIVQNLVLNALSVTERGGVLVTWQEREVSGTPQWIVCVQDTGPGLDIAHAAPFEQMLKQATAESHDVERRAGLAGDDAASAEAAPTLASKSTYPSASAAGGEGIGLSIVKRLCELLDASLELETAAGTGTTFRIVFPRHYDTSDLINA